MPREKKDDVAVEPQAAPSEEIMEVKMRGPAAKVMERLGPEATQPAEPRGNGDVDRAFSEALSNPRYIVAVRRISPRVWQDCKVSYEVLRETCPLTLEDIRGEVEKSVGGGKFNARVVEPETGKIIAGHRFEIDADPILPPENNDDKIAQMLIDGQKPLPKSATEVATDSIDQEIRLAAKRRELTLARQALEDAKATPPRDPSGPVAPSTQTSPLEQRIMELERKLLEEKYESRIVALQREIEEMKRQPIHREDSGLQKLMFDWMKSSEDRFSRLIELMQNNKTDALASEIRALRNKGESGSMLETVETMMKLRKLMDGGSSSDDPDDDGAGEDKPWYEQLADRYIPEILDLIKDRGREGKPMSKEEIAAQVKAAADKAEEEAVQRGRARLIAMQNQVAQQMQRLHGATPAPLPGPASPPPLPPPMPQPLSSGAPAVPAVPSPAPPAAAIPLPMVPPALSVEDQAKLSVGQALSALDDESQLRPRKWEWTFLWWETLPEDILERVCGATSFDEMVQVFSGIAKPEGLAGFQKNVQENPRRRGWIERGLAELRAWHEKAKADPDFDPSGEEPPEETP